ncbi:helix-turn-helix domain-containing protein [Dactylosporangium vinaceum]|uniref:Helix-turn-helix domain-containing protein n=1 Tax=Dactylosporangium vinaceum TaxID=53362 RepID=A0ABV5M2W6_9ACTN|nr:helix-turn-helix transcriptional regulator [Dactylosporangium vinaceum]UAB96364.1 helix-turn-helix domain-containing protein [Dactylosporangium vinaceum]
MEALSPAAVAFGAVLRSWRQRKQWTQQTLGAAVFFSREHVAMVERGLRKPTATFVERAETALEADGALRGAFAQLERELEHDARQRVETRRVQRRGGKIAIVAGRFRAAARRAPCSEQPESGWLAFDDLHRVLKDELGLLDADAEIASLEQRWARLAADAGDGTGWAAVASAAALGCAEAGALLQRSLPSGQARRAVAVARQFAALTADALLMLDQHRRAEEWYGLADTLEHRSAHVPIENMAPTQGASAAAVHDALHRVAAQTLRPTMRPTSMPVHRATCDGKGPSGVEPARVPEGRNGLGCSGRAPPVPPPPRFRSTVPQGAQRLTSCR